MSNIAPVLAYANMSRERSARMGSPAELTILVLLIALGAGLWTVWDKLSQTARDIEAIKRRLGADEPPPPA